MRSLTVPIVCAVTLSTAAGQIPSSATAIEDPEAYAVYASLLGAEVADTGQEVRRVVIQRETVTNTECTISGGALETDWKPVVDDFRIQNAGIRFVLPDRDLRLPYLVVTRKEIRSSFVKGPAGWPDFYKRYPGSAGYVEVSAVGFNRPRTRAMVYMAHHCGGLCGGGSYHLLEKVNGAWREAKVPGVSSCEWVS